MNETGNELHQELEGKREEKRRATIPKAKLDLTVTEF